MKQLRINPPANQRGAFYMTAIMLVLLGGLLTCVLKIAPLYMDHSAIRNSIEALAAKEEYKTMSISDIRKDIIRSLTVNRIEGFDAANITLTKEGSMEYIDMNYESRVNIFANIYAVVAFNDRFAR